MSNPRAAINALRHGHNGPKVDAALAALREAAIEAAAMAVAVSAYRTDSIALFRAPVRRLADGAESDTHNEDIALAVLRALGVVK